MTDALRPVSTRELAARLGCSKEYLRQEIEAGRLKAYRIGRPPLPSTADRRRWKIPGREALRYGRAIKADTTGWLRWLSDQHATFSRAAS